MSSKRSKAIVNVDQLDLSLQRQSGEWTESTRGLREKKAEEEEGYVFMY